MPPTSRAPSRSVLAPSVLGVALSMALLSCAKLPPGYVGREWSSTLRELGIVPIFPPREDVQVGDIYLYTVDPESPAAGKAFRAGDNSLGMAPRWTSLHLLAQARDEYAQRPSWPETPDEDAGLLASPATAAAPPWHQPTRPTGSVFDGPDPANRLRLVAFPEFTATTFSRFDLQALVPVEALSLALGGGRSQVRSVTLKIPAAESYSVSASEVLDQLLEPVHSPDGEALAGGDRWKLKPACMKGLAAYVSARGLETQRPVYLRVVVEVYYARALDISIHAQAVAGFGLGVKPAGPKASAGRTGGGTAGKPAPPGADDSTPPDTTPADAVAAANTALAEAGALTTPGGSVRFVALADDAVGMRRVWQRGIAVGFRGLTLAINPSNGWLVTGPSDAASTVPTLAAASFSRR